MKCSKCNAENAQDALYCRSCNFPLREVKIIKDPPQQDPYPIAQVKQKIIESGSSKMPVDSQNAVFYSGPVSFIRKYLALILLFCLIVTFFTRNNFKSVKVIAPEVLGQPYKEKVTDSQVIEFEKNSYKYEITPLFDYEINALLVSKMNYRAFSIQKFDKVFPYDLCLIWGSNITSGFYRARSVKFTQDSRWCNAEGCGDIRLNGDDFANNHLVVNNSEVEHKLKSLVVGDQIKIKGKLVNVKAHLLGKAGTYDSLNYTWNSGVEKTGLGAGACKVIYVEGMEILKKANVVSYYLFQISLYGLVILAIWKLVGFFKTLK